MDNGQLIIDNDCVAFGDYLNHFPEENTLIIHYTLSIINSFIGTINWNLVTRLVCIFFCFAKENHCVAGPLPGEQQSPGLLLLHYSSLRHRVKK